MRWVQSFSLISAIVPKSAQSCTLQVALKSNQAGDEHNIKWQEIRNVSLYPQGGGRAM
jgi:hypothetical protein